MQAREITLAEGSEGMQKRGRSPGEIIAKLQRGRSPKRNRGPSQSTIYRFLSGSESVRGQKEARVRKPALLRGILGTENATRMKLHKAAGSAYAVTWEDVWKNTKVALKAKGRLSRRRRMPSEDWLGRKMRETYNIRSRPGKRRITRNTDHKMMYSRGVAPSYAQSELIQSSVGAQSELQSELSRSLCFTTESLSRMKKKILLDRRISFARLHDAEIP